MYRWRMLICTVFLAGLTAGCSEDQPNAPTPPEATNADFAKKTADMMKNANAGMDLKKAPPASTPTTK